MCKVWPSVQSRLLGRRWAQSLSLLALIFLPCGVTLAELPCSQRELRAKDTAPVTCVGAEIYGGFHALSPQDKKWPAPTLRSAHTNGQPSHWNGHEQRQMDSLVYLFWRGALPAFNGWETSGFLEYDLGSDGTGHVFTAYVSAQRDWLTLQMGKIEVGDIDLGNAFTPETGKTLLGTYGDWDDAQPNLAIHFQPAKPLLIAMAYSARQEDISPEPSEDKGNISVFNLFAKWRSSKWRGGLEYEAKTFEDNLSNRQPTTALETSTDQPFASNFTQNHTYQPQFFWGAALSYQAPEGLKPFLNYGRQERQPRLPAEADPLWLEQVGLRRIHKTEWNLGIDWKLNEIWGITWGTEYWSDNGRYLTQNQDLRTTSDLQTLYLSFAYSLGSATLSGNYWHSNQKPKEGRDNLASQVDLELSLVF